MSKFDTIELETDPRGFATLWLDRPDKNNAFNAAMIEELIAALQQVQSSGTLRFLILRGRGRHFSAGADLAWMQQSAQLDYTANLADARRLSELMHTLYSLRIPALAVVQGAAFGGALGLICCCDIAIGADDAQLSLSEVRIGLAPAVISPYVVQAIGERAARRYAISAERFGGEQALALGLFAECRPSSELDTALARWIDLLQANGPHAMQATKALLRKVGSGMSTPELRRHTETVIAGIRVNAEGQEGLRAFLEKRSPAWRDAASPHNRKPSP
ncbi:MAG: gamma-carboxygeranoyl-CoA hydratase [Xanthomonadaceae bacterium]|jgi:methylglutaconyl-CoA hydratase|nr:gamma-carboxygeranoyl-CoA hydratase [Xanthomonadaceae bacterium]